MTRVSNARWNLKEFEGKYYKPAESDRIDVTLPADASDSGDEETFHNFYNLCYGNETAWMFGDISFIENIGLTSNNWGWSQYLEELQGTTEGAVIYEGPIYAGAGQEDISKGYEVGWATIKWEDGEVKWDIAEAYGAYLTNEKVWVGNTKLPMVEKGKDKIPTPTNAPGKLIIDPEFDYQGELYIAIHFESYVPCGYPHPETPDILE